MKRGIFLSLNFLSSTLGLAQVNMVPNPSFEMIDSCPFNYQLLHLAKPWQSSSLAPGDLYSCGPPFGVPQNGMGKQYSQSGFSMAGFYGSCQYGFSFFGFELRQYPTMRLNDFLIKGKKYKVEFFVSLSDESQHAVSSIGAYFSPYPVFQNDSTVIRVQPQVLNNDWRILWEKENWMKVEGEFIAEGGEHYMTIGNFFPDSLSNLVTNLGGMWNLAYYYLDDVLVYMDDTISPPPAPVDSVPIEEPIHEIKVPTLIVSGDGTGLEISNLPPNSEFWVYDIVGNLVYYSKTNERKFGLDAPAGVYVYQLSTPQGERKRGKIVVVK